MIMLLFGLKDKLSDLSKLEMKVCKS